MNKLMLGAAALMGLTTAVHLFAGTKDIMTPIMETDLLHPVVRGVAMVVWHMVTLVLALSTLGIAYLSGSQNIALSSFVFALMLGFGLIFLVLNISMFGALFAMPQWTVFLLTATLMGVSVFKSA